MVIFLFKKMLFDKANFTCRTSASITGSARGLGMGLYGRGFTLNNANDNGYNAPANQPIVAGPYTREAGIWGYNEVLLTIEASEFTL